MPQSTVLAFDYGLKNIGVAVGQTLTLSASELPAIKARDGVPDWHIVQQLIEEWQADYVVVGLPLNMDGSDSDMSKRARKFANRLHGRFGCRVELVDERLSSHEAKHIASERGHDGNYRRNPIDSIAAAVVLESWWHLTPPDKPL